MSYVSTARTDRVETLGVLCVARQYLSRECDEIGDALTGRLQPSHERDCVSMPTEFTTEPLHFAAERTH